MSKFKKISSIILSCKTLEQLDSSKNILFNWHIKRNNKEVVQISCLYDLLELRAKQIILGKYINQFNKQLF